MGVLVFKLFAKVCNLLFIDIYGDKKVCDNINFEVNQGDRVALCGKNGCGKSTILKFINGDKNIISRGCFEKTSNLKISCVSQDTSNLNGAFSCQYNKNF